MKNDLTKRRLKKALFFCRFLQLVPFIRAVILNGSLATGQTRAHSDIDLLIIAKTGRIFTVRFFVILLGLVSGQKRSKNDRKAHPGKFCFNYFMTEEFLKIPIGRGEAVDRYCAKNYSQSILLWGDQSLFKKFRRQNQRLFSRYGFSSEKEPGVQPITNLRMFSWIRRAKEFLFSGFLGNGFEKLVKQIQICSIEKDPRTRKFISLITYSDRELRFHPPKEFIF